MMNTIVIAEAGVNHNGSMELARKLIYTAADAGADYIKFQTFNTEKLVLKEARQAEYQKMNMGNEISQYEMLKKLELNAEMHFELIETCKKSGIAFLSTAFDMDSMDLLVRLDLPVWKIPSGEITNLPFLKRIGALGKPVFLSTGMATMREIEDAIKILMIEGTERDKITVLHCTSEYPAPLSEINLKAMISIGETFNVRFGYSDHSEGIEVPLAAVALGASVIEKHFTLNRNMEGPDHKASLEPDELKRMIKGIRNIEIALGDGIKIPTPSEIKNAILVRKSVVAARDIRKGELFSSDNLTVKRPGNGVSPMLWDTLIGIRAKRDYHINEQIEL